MADAQASGACGRKIVWVQVPSPALFFALRIKNWSGGPIWDMQNKKRTLERVPHSEASGIRTPDNLIKSQVLYQLSYTPVFNYFITLGNENAQSRNRTSDTRIFSPLLYQLSYLGMSLSSTLLL